MNVKHKIMGGKQAEHHNNRYNHHGTHEQATPALRKGWNQGIQNKENNINVNNYYVGNRQDPKFEHFDAVKSMDFSKRVKTSMNQHQFGQFRKHKALNQQEELKSSQEFFRFRQKLTTEPHEEVTGSVEVKTFHEASRNGIMTSRDCHEVKRMKNEVIEEIMTNAKRGLCKSFNEFNLGVGFCVNHPTKRAKYRLLSELSEGEEEMFYCSKCAINLLQQNFKIQEIKADEEGQNNSMRLQQITKFQLRLKGLEERAKQEADKNHIKEDLDLIEDEIACSTERFDELIIILQKMRNEWILGLSSLKLKIQNQQKVRRDDIFDMLSNMRDMQQEIKEYKNMKKFAIMKENQFQFIIASLNNKINKFQENLQKAKIPSPCQRLSAQSLNQMQIIDKLKEQMSEPRNKSRERKVREVTFSSKTERKERLSEDSFVCDELKRPFRVLFPSSEEAELSLNSEFNIEKSKMLNSVRERTTYDRYQ